MDSDSKIRKKSKKKQLFLCFSLIMLVLLAIACPGIISRADQYFTERKLYNIQVKRPDCPEVISILGKPDSISTTSNKRFTIYEYPCARIYFYMGKLSTIRCKEGYRPKPPGYKVIWHKIRYRTWPIDTRIS